MSSGHVELIPSEQLMFEKHMNYWINLQSISHDAPDHLNFTIKVKTSDANSSSYQMELSYK
jgi:hypothetical protein